MSTKGKWIDSRLYFYDSARPQELWPAAPEVWLYDDFLGVTTTSIAGRTTGYTGTLPGTADTATLVTTASVSGAAKILSGTTDNDTAFLSTEISFYGKFDCCFETRLTLDAVNDHCLCIGFTDTGGIVNAGPMSLATTTFTTTATDAALFVYDTDATTDYLYCMGVKADVDKTAISTAIRQTGGTYNVFAVHIEDDGTYSNAKFYIDGVLKGTISDCLTRTAALTPVISVGTRTVNNANYALVDYCKAWQRRA